MSAAILNWQPSSNACAVEPAKLTDSAVARSAVNEAKGPVDSAKLKTDLLPNAYQVHEQVVSGGQPQGTAAFELLRQMGVRTVISVDGIRPHVDLARQHDLRYVHLPFGYDGIPAERVKELAHAVLTLPGPLYIHCHHGKHRSPAAAAAASVTAGFIDQNQGLEILRKAGTSQLYKGLWASVGKARPVDTVELTSLEVRFSESVDPPPLVDTMTELEKTIERLENVTGKQWVEDANTVVSRSAAHQSLLLREHFAELARLPSTEEQPEEYRTLITESKDQAALLEALLTNTPPTITRQPARLTVILGAIRNGCRNCHQRFRD